MCKKLKRCAFVFVGIVSISTSKYFLEHQTHTQANNPEKSSIHYIYKARLNKLDKEEAKNKEHSVLINNKTNAKVKVTKVFKYTTRYVSTNILNIREKPSTKSKILGTLKLNKKVCCAKFNNDWYIFNYKGRYCYISSKYLSKHKTELPKGKVFQVPSNRGFMSYMPYSLGGGRSIFSSRSKQRQIQNIAYTGNYGIRQVNGRYCVAIGSYFTSEIGVYFDIVLNNNTVIPCVLADAKANCDTDSSNIITTHDGSVAEFIIDSSALNSNARRYGNIAMSCNEWKSSIKNIVIYDKNCLN